MDLKTKKKPLASRLIKIEDPSDLLNQTDDFSSGCTPFKGAAIKAIQKENVKVRKEKVKKLCKKEKLQKEVLNCSKECSIETTSNCENGNKLEKLPKSKLCGVCGTSIPFQSFPDHLSECMKQNFTNEKNRDVPCQENIMCQICQENITYLTDIQQNLHVNACVDKSTITGIIQENINGNKDDQNRKTMDGETYSTETENTEKCKICGECISSLKTSEKIAHINNCVDQIAEVKHYEKKKEDAIENAKYKVLDCPICGRVIKTHHGRKVHMKKCCTTYNISNTVLEERVKQQQEEYEMRLIAGDVPIDDVQNIKPRPRSKKRNVANVDVGSSSGNAGGNSGVGPVSGQTFTHSNRRLDEDTQLALALSNSLHEQMIPIPLKPKLADPQKIKTSQLAAKDVFSILMSPKTNVKEQAKKRKKKVKICIDKLPLLIQSTEEAYNNLENKVANVLLTQGIGYPVLSSPKFRKSNIALNYTIKLKCVGEDKSQVTKDYWERTKMNGISHADHREMYYVSKLMPPVTFCDIPPGSKFKNLSTVAGWKDSSSPERKIMLNNEVPQEESKDEDMTMLAPSQTAVMLAQLAQEHGTTVIHHNDTTSLNDTIIEENPSGFVHRDNEIHNFECKALDSYASMVNKKEFSDIIITIANGEKIFAHKMIIAARCQVLLKFVMNGVLDISMYSYESVIAFMKYIYAGRVVCQGQTYFELKDLAVQFHVHELLTFCDNMIEAEQLRQKEENLVEEEHFELQKQDKTLQNILREAWGSDSEEEVDHEVEVQDSNDENINPDNDALEDVYEFMATQKSNNKSQTPMKSEVNSDDKLAVLSDEDMDLSQVDIISVSDHESEAKYNQSDLNVTVCERSVDRLKKLTDNEVLERICYQNPSKSLFDLTKMFTGLDSDEESLSNDLSDSDYSNNVSTETINPGKISKLDTLSKNENENNLTPYNQMDSAVYVSDHSGNSNDSLYDENSEHDKVCDKENMIYSAEENIEAELNVPQELDHEAEIPEKYRPNSNCSVIHLSNDNSLFDASTTELFDSFSEDSISQKNSSSILLKTPSNIKENKIFNSFNLKSDDISAHNNSITSTPSPVFKSQKMCKVIVSNSVDDASKSGVQNLVTIFDEQILSKSSNKEDGSISNFNSQKKRKRHDSENEENLKGSQKHRKTKQNLEMDVVSSEENTNSEIIGHIDKKLFDIVTVESNGTFEKNVKLVLDEIEKEDKVKIEKANCIDLTLSDDDDLSENNVDKYDKNNSDLCQGTPVIKETSPVLSAVSIQDIETADNTDIWDDFEDDGFEQHFFNATTPLSNEYNSAIPAISPKLIYREQNKPNDMEPNNFSKKLEYDLISVSISPKKDSSLSLIQNQNSPGNPPSLQKQEFENGVTNMTDVEFSHDTNDISIYDPPTDISANDSSIFDQDQRSTSGKTQNDNVFTPPPVIPQRLQRKKDLSKWKPPSPFTPVPVFTEMNTPQLQKKVKSYGVRVMPKKKMITLLKNIYQETHAYETDPEYDQDEIESLKKRIPQPEEKNPSPELAKVVKKRGKGTTKSIKSKPKTSLSIKNQLTSTIVENSQEDMNYTTSKNTSTVKSTVLVSESSDESSLNDSLPEESILESDDAPKLSKRDVEYKRKQLWEYVKGSEKLQLKILHYEPIELDEFQQELKDKGIKNIGTTVIAEFLDDKNIPFTNRNTNKATYGKKKSRGKDKTKST